MLHPKGVSLSGELHSVLKEFTPEALLPLCLTLLGLELHTKPSFYTLHMHKKGFYKC